MPKTELETFTKKGLSYFLTVLVARLNTLLILPFLTRLLSPRDYGILAVFTSLASLLSVLLSFGVHNSVSRYFFENREESKNFLFSVTLAVLALDFAFFLLFGRFFVDIAEYLSVPTFVVSFSYWLAVIESLRFFSGALFQAQEASFLLNSLKLARTYSYGILAVLLAYALASQKYLGPMSAMLLASSLVTLYSFHQAFKKTEVKFRPSHIRYGFSFGVPLILVGFAELVLLNSDRLMLSAALGPKVAGIYSVTAKIGMVFITLTSAIKTAWMPIFYRCSEKGTLEDLGEVTEKYSFACSLTALALYISGPILIRILAPPEYSKALCLLPIILLGFLYQAVTAVYTYHVFLEKKTAQIAVILVLAAGANLALNHALIPIFGMKGAAWATLISFSLAAGFKYALVKTKYFPKVQTAVVFRDPLIVTGLMASLSLLRPEVSLLSWFITALVVAVLYSYKNGLHLLQYFMKSGTKCL